VDQARGAGVDLSVALAELRASRRSDRLPSIVIFLCLSDSAEHNKTSGLGRHGGLQDFAGAAYVVAGFLDSCAGCTGRHVSCSPGNFLCLWWGVADRHLQGA